MGSTGLSPSPQWPVRPRTVPQNGMCGLALFRFFTKHTVNHLPELAIFHQYIWILLLPLGRFDLLLEADHELLQSVTASLEFLDGNFQLPDFLPQNFRDICFIHK